MFKWLIISFESTVWSGVPFSNPPLGDGERCLYPRHMARRLDKVVTSKWSGRALTREGEGTREGYRLRCWFCCLLSYCFCRIYHCVCVFFFLWSVRWGVSAPLFSAAARASARRGTQAQGASEQTSAASPARQPRAGGAGAPGGAPCCYAYYDYHDYYVHYDYV